MAKKITELNQLAGGSINANLRLIGDQDGTSYKIDPVDIAGGGGASGLAVRSNDATEPASYTLPSDVFTVTRESGSVINNMFLTNHAADPVNTVIRLSALAGSSNVSAGGGGTINNDSGSVTLNNSQTMTLIKVDTTNTWIGFQAANVSSG